MKEITSEERKAAIRQLEQSKAMLLTAVKGLSEAQLNFKSKPESWSVAECAEHLAIVEVGIFGIIEKILRHPDEDSLIGSSKIADENIIKMVSYRPRKIKANEKALPTGRFGSLEEVLKIFTGKRDEHIEYVKTTKDNLRDRYAKFDFGVLDGYQIILFIAGHNNRHVAQIDEIKGGPNFPKE